MTPPHAPNAWLLAALLIAPAAPAVGQQAVAESFGRYVMKVMADWHVPGVGVGIVRNDTVLLARGFGVRRHGHPARVDSLTMFGNGSTSKAFAAASVAATIDAGRLEWDSRVIDHLPEFQLIDPWITREVTVRDLLAHRVGLSGAAQLIKYWNSGVPRGELIRGLRFERQASRFREEFRYHNLLFTAAGEVAARAAGTTWERLVRRTIFEPLGMSSTTTRLSDFQPGGNNVASGHVFDGVVPRPVPWVDLANIGPAGGISSNVTDMLRWVRMLLGAGRFEGRQILSAAVVREQFSPQLMIRPEAVSATGQAVEGQNFAAQGLGWQLFDTRGRKVVAHTGTSNGMRAVVVMVPEEMLGLVVFTNTMLATPRIVLTLTFLDLFLGAERDRDWSAVLLAEDAARRERLDAFERTLAESREPGTESTLPLSRYAGRYEHVDSLIDGVTVEVNGDRLVLTASRGFVGDLTHWHHDVFRAAWRDPVFDTYPFRLRPFVTFVPARTGGVAVMELDGVGRLERKE